MTQVGKNLGKRAGRLIFVRHGESLWNITDSSHNRMTRFTGWANIPMSETGKHQATAAGRCLNKLGIHFDAIYTSVLDRSIDTFEHLVKELKYQKPVPVIHTWRLNERHYGSLVGMSKAAAEEEMGREQVMHWRRSWDGRPPPMTKHPFYHSFIVSDVDGHPPVFIFDWQSEIWTRAMTMTRMPIEIEGEGEGEGNEEEGSEGTKKKAQTHILDGLGERVTEYETLAKIPKSESLRDTARRVLPLWVNEILPRIIKGENILIVGHSNTIRGMVKHLDGISKTKINELSIPSAIPIVYQFEMQQAQNERNTHKDVQLVPVGDTTGIGMTGRFVVTKELLKLTIAARQQFELSENLDEDGGKEFIQSVQRALHQIQADGGDAENADKNKDEERKCSQEDKDEDVAVEMDQGWMTFQISNSEQMKDAPWL